MSFLLWIISFLNLITNTVSKLYEYRTIYKILGIFCTRKFKPAKNLHKYAVLIAARNEEAVIGKLIDSIKKQNYPEDLVSIFVVADNCTDNTAEMARSCGAICYERFDQTRRTKGFALQFLVECIRKDYGIKAFEGYFIFDADNLLDKNFILKMNDSFDAGEKIITSYRNAKNFADNWISASYAIHWLRTVRNEHRARSVFHLATRIQGTGFLFSNELILDGWNYTSLTEDRAFCADAVARGYKISYNNEAIFYDEQPIDIKIAMRQRIRWAKGHLQALGETGPSLLSHIFITKGMANKNYVTGEPTETNTFKKILNNIRLRFMSFDMLTVVFPRSLLNSLKKIIVFFIRIALVLMGGLFVTQNFAPDFLKNLLKLFGVSSFRTSGGTAIGLLAIFFVAWTVSSYLNGIYTAIYVFIIEHRRIKKMPLYKKIWFCLTFPMFDLIGKISMLIAMFMKVEWKEIPHNVAVDISELEE